MRRREFIAGLGSAVVPLEARAQLGDRARRIGMLLPYDQNDPVAKTRVSAFMQALAELGWTDGHNVRMDLGWAGGDINRIRALAHELVALQPDIVVAGGTLTIAALQRETTTIPIVMTNVADPVGSGFVAALNRPGGNITGFAIFETSLGGKLLELLSEIATGLKRVALMFNANAGPASGYIASFETAAQSLKVEPINCGRS
jgi:putative ABC transport system substrate-binding protein